MKFSLILRRLRSFAGRERPRTSENQAKWSLAKSCFKQNYCHACHTRFAVFFPLHKDLNIFNLDFINWDSSLFTRWVPGLTITICNKIPTLFYLFVFSLLLMPVFREKNDSRLRKRLKCRPVASRYHSIKISGSHKSFLRKGVGHRFIRECNHARESYTTQLYRSFSAIFAGSPFVEILKFCYHGNVT